MTTPVTPALHLIADRSTGEVWGQGGWTRDGRVCVWVLRASAEAERAQLTRGEVVEYLRSDLVPALRPFLPLEP